MHALMCYLLGPVMGVRTMGSTSLLQLKYTPGRGRTPPAMELAPILTVRRSDVGDRHAVDITLSSVEATCGYVVNDAGDVFRCRVSAGNKAV